MNTSMPKAIAVFLMAHMLFGFPPVGPAQDKPANNLEATHEKLKADKKLIVGKYLELTDSETKKFWPVYEEYQKDLQKLNERLGSLLQSYSTEYRSNSLSDETAKKLLDEWLALNKDEAKRRASYVPKVMKVL